MSCVVYLISFEDETSYIGSTRDLQQRMYAHKTKCFNDNSERPLYCKMREIAFGVSILEETTEENRRICEQKWIDELKPDLNMISAFTGGGKACYKKWYEKHKETILKNNRERLKERVLCDCGIYIDKRNIARHKLTKKHLSNI